MPEVLTITQKCDRLSQLMGQMGSIVRNADGIPREYTADEAVTFDALKSEALTLKAEIDTHKAASHRLETVDELKAWADKTPKHPPAMDNPTAVLKQAREDMESGRYSLRFFKGERAHERAYDSGLLLLAKLGSGDVREWAHQRCSDRGVNVKKLAAVQQEDGNSQGGFLVHPAFESTLINLKESYGVIQREAYRIPMGSDTLSFPRRAGGLTVYYPAEGGEITASAMKFDQISLTAKKYACMTKWSSELNEDSVIAMADLLSGEMAYQFSYAEDLNGFLGDGTSTYCGTTGLLKRFELGANGVIPTASVHTATGHTSISATTLADWEAMVGVLPTFSEGRAQWYMHKTVFWAGPARLIDATGGSIAAYVATGAPLRFLGYEVVPVQAMTTNSSLTTGTYAAVLGDLSNTIFLGTRRGVTMKMSDQRYIEYDQLAIQCTQRVAINPVVGDAVAPTSVAGPAVCLKLG